MYDIRKDYIKCDVSVRFEEGILLNVMLVGDLRKGEVSVRFYVGNLLSVMSV